MSEELSTIKTQIKKYYKSAVIPCFYERNLDKSKCKRENLERIDAKSEEIRKSILHLALEGCGEAMLLCLSRKGIYDSLVINLAKEGFLSETEREKCYNMLFRKSSIYSDDSYNFFDNGKDGCSIMLLIAGYNELAQCEYGERTKKTSEYNESVKKLAKSRRETIAKIFDKDADFIEHFFLNIATYDIIEDAYEFCHNEKHSFEQKEILFFDSLYMKYKEAHTEYYETEYPMKIRVIEENYKKIQPLLKQQNNSDSLKYWEDKSEEQIRERLLNFKDEEKEDFLNILLTPVNKGMFKQKFIFISLFYKEHNEPLLKAVNKFIKEIIAAKNSNDKDRFFQLPYDLILNFVKSHKKHKDVISVIENHFIHIINSNKTEDVIKILRLMKEVDKIDYYMNDYDFLLKIGSEKFGLLISKLYSVFGKEPSFFSLLYKGMYVLVKNDIMLEYIEPIAVFAWNEKIISSIFDWLIRQDSELALEFSKHIEKRCYKINDEFQKLREYEKLKEQEMFEQFAEKIAKPLSDIESEIAAANPTDEITKQLQEHTMTVFKEFRGAIAEFGLDTVVNKEQWGDIAAFNPEQHSNITNTKCVAGENVKILSLGLKVTRFGDKRWKGKIKSLGGDDSVRNL